MKFEDTGLWIRAIGGESEQHASERERLRAAYKIFWANACQLSSQIARDLPTLTLHNEAHFEALWDRADQIAGPDFILTPIEIFVFGGAILIHDAANSTAVFENGLKDVESTPEWQDAVADITDDERIGSGSIVLPPELHNKAMLQTLRVLHAQKAEELGSISFKNGHTNTTVNLISDDQLRNQLGSIIGLIAASHHWNIHELERRLSNKPLGAIAGLPRDWIIRPIVLACLLRCADAVQIDQSRAPDFLFAILKLRGVSESHWRAQNKLTAPVVDKDDSKSLIFSSSNPYFEADADAWWIAYDAIQVAHAELQAANVLLNDLRLPTFSIDRVRSAESPTRLARLVEARGWRPVSANVRVTRVDRIVDMFGGDKLYGNEYSVPIREMIQNGADAVQLRRQADPDDPDYVGKVVVRLERGIEGEIEGFWLKIEDDGIGMSEGTLTGPLIEFGSSYITSDLAKKENPGLSAKGKKRIGRYGIGFFSIFMLAKRVLVTSRPFRSGLDASRTLSFRAGMALRPLLLDTQASESSVSVSTRVSAFLSAETLSKVLEVRTGNNNDVWSLNLEQLVGMLCPAVDVDIFVQDAGGKRAQVHKKRWFDGDKLGWLRRISLADIRKDDELDEALSSAAPLLDFVDADDTSAGFAAVAFKKVEAGVQTIGGLRAGQKGTNPFAKQHIGTFDHESGGPDRSLWLGHMRASPARWATRQAERIARETDDVVEHHRAAIVVVNCGGDPLPIAGMLINRMATSINDIFSNLRAGGEIFAPLAREHHFSREENIVVITTLRIPRFAIFQNFLKLEEIEPVCTYMEPIVVDGHHQLFYRLPSEADAAETSFIGCLKRKALSEGHELLMEVVDNVLLARYVGRSSDRDGLQTGDEMRRASLRLRSRSLAEMGT